MSVEQPLARGVCERDMTVSLDPALLIAENERIEKALQLLRGFLRPPALARSRAPEKQEAPGGPIELQSPAANSWEFLR